MGTAFKTFAGLSFVIGGSTGIDSELLEREHELELQTVEFEGGDERGDGTIELVVELEDEEVVISSLLVLRMIRNHPRQKIVCCSSSALDAVSWEDNF